MYDRVGFCTRIDIFDSSSYSYFTSFDELNGFGDGIDDDTYDGFCVDDIFDIFDDSFDGLYGHNGLNGLNDSFDGLYGLNGLNGLNGLQGLNGLDDGFDSNIADDRLNGFKYYISYGSYDAFDGIFNDEFDDFAMD